MKPVTYPERARNTLDAGEVRRYHAVPSVAPQSVGLHSWGVAVICLYLTEGRASGVLLTEALLHDTEELFTGDIPFTVKRDVPAVKSMFAELSSVARANWLLPNKGSLLPKEEAILKLADTLDGLIWCRKHEAHGPVGGRWSDSLDRACDKFLPLLQDDTIVRARTLVELIKKEPHLP